MLFRNDPDELLAFDQYPVVSASLPTDPAGREVRQYAIHLWSLRQDGNVMLVDRGRLPPRQAGRRDPALLRARPLR